jgi:hypothetical protein
MGLAVLSACLLALGYASYRFYRADSAAADSDWQAAHYVPRAFLAGVHCRVDSSGLATAYPQAPIPIINTGNSLDPSLVDVARYCTVRLPGILAEDADLRESIVPLIYRFCNSGHTCTDVTVVRNGRRVTYSDLWTLTDRMRTLEDNGLAHDSEAQSLLTAVIYEAAVGGLLLVAWLVTTRVAARRRPGGSVTQPGRPRLQQQGTVLGPGSGEWPQVLTQKLVSSALSALRDPAAVERYSEEWAGDLAEITGKWRRLRWALLLRLFAPRGIRAAFRAPAPERY